MTRVDENLDSQSVKQAAEQQTPPLRPLQVGLHHQEGLPGDGRSPPEFSHHQSQRAGGYKQQPVGSEAVGSGGLRLPAAGSSDKVAGRQLRRTRRNSVNVELRLSALIGSDPQANRHCS